MNDAHSGSLGGGSFVRRGSKRSFDVRKEADVIELLRIVHTQTIDGEIKNHLRDLLFTYRQTLQLEDAQRVAQGFVPLDIEVLFSDVKGSEVPKPVASVKGFMRPMPRFVPIRVVPVSAEVTPVQAAPSAPAQEPVIAAVPEAVVTPPVQTPAPTTPVTTSAPALSSDSVTERIKEIKRLVNEKVGNPVNLMDTHAEIGREYMNALLDAMKKSNGAGMGELGAAMQRLESAFTQVQTVILSEPTHREPEVQQPTPEVVPAVSVPVKSVTEPISKASDLEHAPLQAVREVTEPTRLVSVKESTLEKTPQQAPVFDAVVAPKPASPNIAPQQQAVQSEPLIHSVAKEKQLQELLRVSKEREAQTKIQAEEVKNATGDPLQTPEVTAGLNQLLSEWGLFKSSGLFGTGPNGKDHPLFKKLETLTMAAVIAGRFEGATPAIKQSITDYMNGWRYEEGIVHDHMETFEHYLRKVVAQILNRKKLR